MGIFLDSSFYYAILRRDDVNHERANEILDMLANNQYGKVYTSEYILDESMTLISVRSHGQRDLIERMGKLFLGNEKIAHMLPIESDWLEEIYMLQMNLTAEHHEYSFTDCSSIVCCKKHKIPRIVSFDGHFSGQLEQIHELATSIRACITD